MSGLRRRIFGGTNSNESSRTPSPVPSFRKGDTDGSGDPHVSVPAKKLERLNSYIQEKKPAKGHKRRNAWIFGLGSLVGILGALAFAGNSDVIDFSSIKDMNLDGLFDVLPAGLVRDAQRLQVCLFCHLSLLVR